MDMETAAKKPDRTEAQLNRTKTKAKTPSGSPSATYLRDTAKRVGIVEEREGKVIGTPRRERAKLREEIKDSTLHLRLREGLKEDATSVLADIGISVPEAIRVFLGRIVSEGRLPFELEVPNAVTRRAMEEARRIGGGRFATAGELFDDLDNGGAR